MSLMEKSRIPNPQFAQFMISNGLSCSGPDVSRIPNYAQKERLRKMFDSVCAVWRVRRQWGRYPPWGIMVYQADGLCDACEARYFAALMRARHY
ncbi:hypothetical protein I350_00871 [Cryptococcus amylolentus CBS 6273]|uniref:Uncharacterized protein n=1 Tax=Cryptococcus amylolentus CBS 6273 TaxID=1296118 RepID=A0A1E3KGE3_9TREE|nr:hypothetical protein I350_00871 [Cryptococcus amylolentus CBS 6273]